MLNKSRNRIIRSMRFMPWHGRCALLGLGLLSYIALVGSCSAGTALGDGGHFLKYGTKVSLLNPDGRAFTVTVHLFRWPVAQWNPAEVALRIIDPNGKALVEGAPAFPGDSRTFPIPAGLKGVYSVEMNMGTPPNPQTPGNVDCFIESSLDRSVVGTGLPHEHAVRGGRWMIVQCSVPRRYWFWVPAGTKSFTCRTQSIPSYQSQREDWGITIFSPRGQRVRQLWGDLDWEKGPYNDPDPKGPLGTIESRTMATKVNVEPSAGGRFWCVEIRFADSHNYSKISFSLDGVPPYLARSPEEWFNPETGESPKVDPYDNDAFMQYARSSKSDGWPFLENFSPCPSLGDPDGASVRGDATFALWNPEDRPLKFKVGTYLTRDMGTTNTPQKAGVKITGADGKVIVDRQDPIETLHYGGAGMPETIPLTGKGVAKVSISGAERWIAFTYPATPLVLIGQELESGWSRFNLEVGTARNWYFFVPRGTKAFSVRASVQHEQDVMNLEINAPDRTLAVIYDRAGEKTVTVPAGLDGKIWHLRGDIGSATVMKTPGGPDTRFLGLYLTLDLKGVPGYLSPTWEQWFDPNKPVAPVVRSEYE